MIPWITARQASLSFTVFQNLLKLMSMESVIPSNHLILCCSLLLSPSILPSIWVFSKELTLHIRWPKYWSFSFSISPSNEYSGLISFSIDWLISLESKGLSKVFSGTTIWKAKALNLYNKILWKRERLPSFNFHYSILLKLFYFIITVTLLLVLIYILNFTRGMYALEQGQCV